MFNYSIKIFRDLPLSHLQNAEQYKGRLVVREIVFEDYDDDYSVPISGIFSLFREGSFDISKDIIKETLEFAKEEEEDVEDETKEYLKTIISKMEDGVVYECEINFDD